MQKFSSFLSWQKDKKIIWMVVADPKQGGSLTAFPHKSPSIADYIIGVHLFTQIWFTKVFISHTNTMRIEIHNITHWAIPAQKNITHWALHGVCSQSNSSPQSIVSNIWQRRQRSTIGSDLMCDTNTCVNHINASPCWCSFYWNWPKCSSLNI